MRSGKPFSRTFCRASLLVATTLIGVVSGCTHAAEFRRSDPPRAALSAGPIAGRIAIVRARGFDPTGVEEALLAAGATIVGRGADY